jgi:hypothetical protein
VVQVAREQRRKGGRFTPKGGGTPPSSRSRATPSSNPATAPQVGRRPSPPWLLMVIALMWLAAGAFVWSRLDASWKLVPAAVFVGIGFFYLRGALQTIVRHDERRGEGESR